MFKPCFVLAHDLKNSMFKFYKRHLWRKLEHFVLYKREKKNPEWKENFPLWMEHCWDNNKRHTKDKCAACSKKKALTNKYFVGSPLTLNYCTHLAWQ